MGLILTPMKSSKQSSVTRPWGRSRRVKWDEVRKKSMSQILKGREAIAQKLGLLLRQMEGTTGFYTVHAEYQKGRQGQWVRKKAGIQICWRDEVVCSDGFHFLSEI